MTEKDPLTNEIAKDTNLKPKVNKTARNKIELVEAPSILNSLSRRQKVAAIIVSLNKEQAANVLSQFNHHDLALLNEAAQTLPVIEPSDFEKLVQEFEDSYADGGVISEAGIQFNNLIKDALGDDVAKNILDNPVEPVDPGSVWEILSNLTAEQIYFYLSDEHPQLFAYVFSKLPSDLASRLLLVIPTKERSEIIKRTLNLGGITPSARQLIEEILSDKLNKYYSSDQNQQYSHIANVFNNLDKDQLNSVINQLSGLDQSDIDNIKSKLFTFDDLPRLSHEALLLVFDQIDINTVINATIRANSHVKELILNSLSHRSRRLIESELSATNINISNQDIIDAQRKIARRVIDLASQGRIRINSF